MILSLPQQEDVVMSENSFAEESEEETLRRLQEDLMDVPESTQDIIDIISSTRNASPKRESGLGLLEILKYLTYFSGSSTIGSQSGGSTKGAVRPTAVRGSPIPSPRDSRPS